MKRLVIALSLTVFLPWSAFGQQPHARQREPERRISLGELSPTPEMWFYEQALRQYEDPKTMVRQKAEFKAVQRERRLAALEWYGYSNSRPQMSPDPMYGSSSPHWSSNSYDPFRWRGGRSVTIFRGSDLGYYRR